MNRSQALASAYRMDLDTEKISFPWQLSSGAYWKCRRKFAGRTKASHKWLCNELSFVDLRYLYRHYLVRNNFKCKEFGPILGGKEVTF